MLWGRRRFGLVATAGCLLLHHCQFLGFFSVLLLKLLHLDLESSPLLSNPLVFHLFLFDLVLVSHRSCGKISGDRSLVSIEVGAPKNGLGTYQVKSIVRLLLRRVSQRDRIDRGYRRHRNAGGKANSHCCNPGRDPVRAAAT